MLGADGVVIGTVDEYATVAQGGHPHPSVGVSVRMIDCASGKVLWSADLAAMADNAKTTLPMEARIVVHELVAGLYQNWGVQTTVARQPATPANAEPTPEQAVGGRPLAAPAADQAGASTVMAPTSDVTPAMPADFKTSDLGLREVLLTWSAPAAATLKFRIERAPSDAGPFELVSTVPADKKAYRDTGLKDSTGYFYRMIAVVDTGATSLPTRVQESMTAPPPEPPPAVRATAPASRALCVAWTASPAEGVTSYIIERAIAADGPYVKVGETERTEFQEGGTQKTDLRDSTPYFYRITALNRVGAVGPPSKPAAVTTLPPPAPVRGLLARSAEVRCVPLTWSASPENDVVRYDVYRRDAASTNFTLLASVKGREKTGHLDGGRDPGALGDQCAYEYRVRAINAVTAEARTVHRSRPSPAACPPPSPVWKPRPGNPGKSRSSGHSPRMKRWWAMKSSASRPSPRRPTRSAKSVVGLP